MKKKIGIFILIGILLAGVILIVYARSIVTLLGVMWESAPIKIYNNIDDYERYRSGFLVTRLRSIRVTMALREKATTNYLRFMPIPTMDLFMQ